MESYIPCESWANPIDVSNGTWENLSDADQTPTH